MENFSLGFNRERQSALLAIGYGIYISAAQTFGNGNPIYAPMNRVAHTLAPGVDEEAVWTSLLIAAGLLQVIAILIGNRFLRRVGLILVGALFCLMAVCFALASPRSPACFTYLVLGLGNFVIRRRPAAMAAPGDSPAPPASA